nr:hypothetical protein [bacterium]
MSSISQKKNALFREARRLKKQIFLESTKKGNKKEHFNKARELQKIEDEVWKKKMFYENFIKEMEKLNGKN